MLNTDDFLVPISQALSEADFAQKLGQDGLELKVVAGDGNCMFRSVADQVYGDEDMHEQVRACCLDYMVRFLFLTLILMESIPGHLQSSLLTPWFVDTGARV